MRSFW